MAAPGSGEHALRHLLAPFAWGREPLEDALKQIKVGYRLCPPSSRITQISLAVRWTGGELTRCSDWGHVIFMQ